jgi:hypothetical protein
MAAAISEIWNRDLPPDTASALNDFRTKIEEACSNCDARAARLNR